MNMTSTEAAALRTELQETTQGWQPDSKPSQTADIFFPSAHIRALALDRPLVIGMRGAGKSFWSEVLTDASLRPAITQSVKGYDKLMNVVSIRWDQGNEFSTRLPDSTALTEALQQGMEPRLLWLTLVLNELRSVCAEYRIAVSLPEISQGWHHLLSWATQHSEAIRRAFEQLNTALTDSGQVVLVVMDALDRMAARLAQSVDCLRGLLQLLLDARQLKGLRFKVFLREDMAHMPSVLSFPDASKLLNEAVHLHWSREDIYALHWHKLAQKSPLFQQLIESHFGPGKPTLEGYQHPLWGPSPPEEGQLTALLKLLAQPYMGKNVTKGHVYSWWYKHLADGKNRVSPRTFAASLRTALDDSSKIDSSHVLSPTGIKQGVRMASEARVQELRDDYFWVHTALAAFNDRLTPILVKEIYGVWNGIGIEGQPTPRLIREQCLAKKVFIPWDDSDPLTSSSQKLRDALVELGILMLRDKDTRLDMPDIYRLGYGIRKRGGVSPRR
ncbi:MAG: hypothetical protein K2X65_02625 [Burkholderiaceae bacterium]|nr:hypothetical protein [Burkholderiaceae bacterium]